MVAAAEVFHQLDVLDPNERAHTQCAAADNLAGQTCRFLLLPLPQPPRLLSTGFILHCVLFTS